VMAEVLEMVKTGMVVIGMASIVAAVAVVAVVAAVAVVVVAVVVAVAAAGVEFDGASEGPE
jgi:hypothetical protein